MEPTFSRPAFDNGRKEIGNSYFGDSCLGVHLLNGAEGTMVRRSQIVIGSIDLGYPQYSG